MVDESALLAAVKEDAAVKLLQKVIQTESTNPPGNELDLALWLKDYFAQAGVKAELFEYESKRVNLVARVPGTGKGPALIFSAHMDTVPAGEVPWMFPPFSATLHEGKIYGRGAADMKSGLAAMAQAAAILARSGVSLGGDLIVAFTHDETHGLRGAKRLVESGHLDDASAVLVSEPSTLDVFIAEKGALWLRCSAEGKTAHTSMPHLGRNAILEIVHFLHRLEQSLDLSADPHPLLGNATFSVGTIKGGVIVNMVPDSCEVEVDIRLTPGMDHEKVVQQVTDLGQGKVQVEVMDWKQPVETDPQDRIVGISLDAVEQVTGVPRQPKGVSYFTDGSILANRLHIPMAIIGPADTVLTHQPNEFVEVERLVQAVKAYLLIAARYLA
jgi:succinyl-diaminopimelate desuccinylase